MEGRGLAVALLRSLWASRQGKEVMRVVTAVEARLDAAGR